MLLQRYFDSSLVSVVRAGQTYAEHKTPGLAECPMGPEDKGNMEVIPQASLISPF